MDVPQMISDLTSHFATLASDAERFAAEHLPVLQDLAAAASNPVVASVLRAVHIPPEVLAALASVIDQAEAGLAASEAARQAAEAARQAAEAALQPPAPDPDQPA